MRRLSPFARRLVAVAAGGFLLRAVYALAVAPDSLDHRGDPRFFHLAANLLWLNDRHAISGAACRKTNALLRSKGYEVHEVDFSQLVCLWGSVRCVTCPLVRG